ncbi:MAG: UDP-N-acetylmuramoyl-L-alanyl-D-glutamate--2,6-diaminopimelate ligase [Candidatus Omnitrophica bacterium]|nr:UDP-N-acetylmuramoyl-L-alanyl-D-glutamate--2,6-diaminopimelate ligase [Candidatus Omnitrophota bacterium]
MTLSELLAGIYDGEIDPRFKETEIFSISCDSRKVMMGGLFVALQGFAQNGADFIEAAIGKGAYAVATSADVDRLRKEYHRVCFLKVDNPREFLQGAVYKYLGNPSNDVRTIGITGTNGKTTITYLIESILKEAGKECGVVGTVNYRLADNVVPARQTTPSFIDNQHFLKGLALQRVPYCAIEVSSHALTQGRVHGINFRGAVFTNLTNDHLDYHETIENYFAVKSLLFTGLASEATAVINIDDPYGRRLLPMTKANVFTYGIKNQADVMAKDVQLDISGSRLILACPTGESEIQTPFIGIYNVYNILAAASICLAERLDLNIIKRGIERLSIVPGRLERVSCGQDFSIFIDYAHTPDALENVLTALREVSRTRIILVFGCGGNRDKSKRALMGNAADRLADFSIVTSDNPRNEDPRSIIDQIIPGFHHDHYKVIVNRKEAIHHALKMAKPGDMVLIAGKGHENYQVFADGPVHFNEREIIEKIFKC